MAKPHLEDYRALEELLGSQRQALAEGDMARLDALIPEIQKHLDRICRTDSEFAELGSEEKKRLCETIVALQSEVEQSLACWQTWQEELSSQQQHLRTARCYLRSRVEQAQHRPHRTSHSA